MWVERIHNRREYPQAARPSLTRTQPDDPYLQPDTAPRDRLLRLLWGVARLFLFRLTPRPLHAWRSLVLRAFGAKLGRRCAIYPRADIWAPWNLECEDVVTIADDAILYNPRPVRLGSHAIVSREAYLCGASHDCDDPVFPRVEGPIAVGPYAWICARATVMLNVTVGEGAVLALSSVATRDLEPWSVYAGVPARKVRDRRRIATSMRHEASAGHAARARSVTDSA